MRTLTPPTAALSIVFIGATARNLPERFDEKDGEAYEIVYPEPTLQAVEDHGQDILTDYLVEVRDERYPEEDFAEGERPLVRAEDLTDAEVEGLLEKFEGTDAEQEWKSGFDPMMSFYWPVDTAYGVSAETAAQLMDEFAGVCTLVRFNDDDNYGEYGIALSGGGMNLADKLAIAYLCCGAVPPNELLNSLSGVIQDSCLAEVRDALLGAYERAAEVLRADATRLDQERERLFAKTPEPA